MAHKEEDKCDINQEQQQLIGPSRERESTELKPKEATTFEELERSLEAFLQSDDQATLPEKPDQNHRINKEGDESDEDSYEEPEIESDEETLAAEPFPSIVSSSANEFLMRFKEAPSELTSALSAILRALDESDSVSSEDLELFCNKFFILDDESDVITLVVLLGSLVVRCPIALINLADLLVSSLWIMEARWMLVVSQMTGDTPLLAVPDYQQFWYSVNRMLPKLEDQVEVLTILESLIQEALAEVEDAHKMNLGFDLDELPSLLNFREASRSPFSIKDIRRLSNQVSLRNHLADACGEYYTFDTQTRKCIFYLELAYPELCQAKDVITAIANSCNQENLIVSLLDCLTSERFVTADNVVENSGIPLDKTISDVLNALGPDVDLELVSQAAAMVSQIKEARGVPVGSSDKNIGILNRLDSMVFSTFKYYPYDVQWFAVCMAALAPESPIQKIARIIQMETGEGKTLVFGLISSYFALNKRTVDVVTSSSQLAKEAVESFGPFFDALGISYGCVEDGVKSDVYKNHVVYGTLSQLAGDYLRSVNSDEGRLIDRKFDVLLLDEADAALVDNSSTLTMISRRVDGMDRLWFVYGLIYQKCIRAQDVSGGDRTVMPSKDDPDFRIQLGLPLKEELPDDTDSNDKQDSTENVIKVIPEIFCRMLDAKLESYITNCWSASNVLKDGRQYMQSGDEIRVIDNQVSGEVQSSSVYSHGLHQFLQIKRQVILTPESLNSVFISTGGFVRKYSHIAGITGTIGNQIDRKAIEKVLSKHAVSFIELPRSKPRPFVELPWLVFNTSEHWQAEIINEVQRYSKHRSILLIFEDKASADAACSWFQNLSVKNNVLNDDNRTFKSTDELNAGDIVITTAFGGRGTDYKLSKAVLEHGGLHTILAYHPGHQRMMQQGFGRSSRCGQAGSAVLICRDASLESDDFQCRLDELITQSEAEYEANVEEQLKNNFSMNVALDDLFEKFSGYLDELKLNRSTITQEYEYNALWDRFGLFVDEISTDTDIMGAESDEILQLVQLRYSDWLRALEADQAAGTVINNARSLNILGFRLNSALKFQEAMLVLERAIQLDSSLASPAAHLNLIRAKVTMDKPNIKNNSEATKKMLLAAQKSFDDEIEWYSGLNLLVVSEKGSKLDSQIGEHLNILSILKYQVDEALNALEGFRKDCKDDEYLAVQFDPLPEEVGEKVLKIFVDEFNHNGYPGMLSLKKEKPWSWDWNAFGCLLLGIAQAVAGACLMALTAGSFGMGLIAEGISDVVTGLQAVIKGDGSFSWTEYFKDKAISLAISVACSGIAKLGKLAFKAGKYVLKNGVKMIKSSVRMAKSAWKNGLRATLKSMKGAVKRGLSRAKDAAFKQARKALEPLRKGLQKGFKAGVKEGLVRAGNKIGNVVIKKIAIQGANIAVNAALNASFDSIENLIRERVRGVIDLWINNTSKPLQRLLGINRTVTQDLIAHVLLSISTDSELVSLGKKFAASLASEVSEQLRKKETPKAGFLASGLSALVEGAKMAEMIAASATFTQGVLDKASEFVESNIEHMHCAVLTPEERVNVEKKLDAAKFQAPCSLMNHWKVPAAAVNEKKPSVLKQSADVKKVLEKVDLHSAAENIAQWDTQRGLLVHQLSDLCAQNIRRTIQSRATEIGQRISAYGLGKLVDKGQDMYLVNKARRLEKSLNKAETEAEMDVVLKKMKRFMGDDDVAKQTSNSSKAVLEEDKLAGKGHLAALAMANDVAVTITDENGKETVINPNGANKINLVSSGSKTEAHLRPVNDVGYQESGNESANDCMFRSFYYATNNQNASENQISDMRETLSELLKGSERLQLQLFVFKSSSARWGGETKAQRAQRMAKEKHIKNITKIQTPGVDSNRPDQAAEKLEKDILAKLDGMTDARLAAQVAKHYVINVKDANALGVEEYSVNVVEKTGKAENGKPRRVFFKWDSDNATNPNDKLQQLAHYGCEYQQNGKKVENLGHYSYEGAVVEHHRDDEKRPFVVKKYTIDYDAQAGCNVEVKVRVAKEKEAEWNRQYEKPLGKFRPTRGIIVKNEKVEGGAK
ncbi:hypothetical protein HDU99_006855 [Rhizoclosmatium hyalinum]|nr:hypothetical protein HDU99_006855 [Rhizoclosmatium hyalinum]